MTFGYNLNFDEVLIPNKTNFDWGILCDEKNPDCEMSSTVAQGTYENSTYKGLRGNVTLKLIKDQ